MPSEEELEAAATPGGRQKFLQTVDEDGHQVFTTWRVHHSASYRSFKSLAEAEEVYRRTRLGKGDVKALEMVVTTRLELEIT